MDGSVHGGSNDDVGILHGETVWCVESDVKKRDLFQSLYRSMVDVGILHDGTSWCVGSDVEKKDLLQSLYRLVRNIFDFGHSCKHRLVSD